MIRIIFSLPHITIGGAQRVCINLIKWLQEKKKVEILLLIGSQEETNGFKFNLAGINHEYLNNGTFGKIQSIRKAVKSFHPDLFISFGVPNCIYDIPGILGLHVKNIVCERNDPSHFSGRVFTRIVSRLFMRKSNGFVFQTKDAQQYYSKRIAKNSKIIPNPLFLSEELKTLPIPNDRENIIVTTGRLNSQKNHALLIRAFYSISKNYPDLKLVIYGDGPERIKDENLIKSLGLKDRVILPGTIKNVMETIQTARLFVMSSDFEGMPNSLMEAMAMGLPCISTNCPCGGPRDLIQNGVNGLLVPIADEKSMVEAMEKVLRNPELANAMGREALKVRTLLSMETIGESWYDYFNEVLNS